MIQTCVLSPKLICLPFIHPIRKTSAFNSSIYINPITKIYRKRDSISLSPVKVAEIDVEYLQSEFSMNGVSFTEINDSCVVRMAMENRSVANLLLPSGVITSYKAPMWHGGVMELLHTTVSPGENGGPAIVRGGILLDLNIENDKGVLWCPNSWVLHHVHGSTQELIQVELISRDTEGRVQVRYIITLEQESLSSEIIISNSSDSSFQLKGSLISHLAVSTPEATYAMGLQGSDFFTRSPIMTNYCIVPPDFGKTRDNNSWNPMSLLSNNSASMVEKSEEVGEEDDNYKHLTEEISKIYTSAPRSFTIIDRGRRNSVIINGDGFTEVYLLSPGSTHQSYGQYSFISIGRTALLQPIAIKSKGKWKGKQELCNPNL